jgi:uncharacterized protein YoxC
MTLPLIALDLAIALLGLYLTWQVWKLRRTLANVADTVTSIERQTHRVLTEAPAVLAQGQHRTQQARQLYRQLERQLQRLQQMFALLGWGRRLWRARSRLSSFEGQSDRAGSTD